MVRYGSIEFRGEVVAVRVSAQGVGKFDVRFVVQCATDARRSRF